MSLNRNSHKPIDHVELEPKIQRQREKKEEIKNKTNTQTKINQQNKLHTLLTFLGVTKNLTLFSVPL
jgi:hypothetical protein